MTFLDEAGRPMEHQPLSTTGTTAPISAAYWRVRSAGREMPQFEAFLQELGYRYQRERGNAAYGMFPAIVERASREGTGGGIKPLGHLRGNAVADAALRSRPAANATSAASSPVPMRIIDAGSGTSEYGLEPEATRRLLLHTVRAQRRQAVEIRVDTNPGRPVKNLGPERRLEA
jgi:hypothetical protein